MLCQLVGIIMNNDAKLKIDNIFDTNALGLEKMHNSNQF